MFMHADWLHLIGNMLFLWIFGDNVEARLGHVGYLVAYLVVGLVSVTVFAAFNAGSATPLVGASGAISGVEGLYFVACPGNRVKLFIFIYYYIRVVLVSARWVMALWFVLQDLLPILIAGGSAGGVAHVAHIGEFAAGLCIMFALRPVLSQRFTERWTCEDVERPGVRPGEWRERPRYRDWE